MKKYIQPSSIEIALDAKESMMVSLSGNPEDRVTEDTNWTNKKGSDFGSSCIWGEEE